MDPVTIGLIASAVVGAGTTAYSMDAQRKAGNETKDAMKANQPAKLPESQADKAPDVQQLRKQQQQVYGAQGPASTLLTGASGVDPGSLSLGKNTLLGA